MKTKPPLQYRQGDVLLVRTTAATATSNPPQALVTVAYGEATGHHHSFLPGHAAMTVAGTVQTVSVTGIAFDDPMPIVERRRGGMIVADTPVGQVGFAEGDVAEAAGMIRVRGKFGVLAHQEHTPLAIPAGTYQRRGTQREYHPTAIRNVAD